MNADIRRLEVLEMHKKDLELIEDLKKVVDNQESRITILKEMVHLQNERTDACSEAILELVKIVSDLIDEVEKFKKKKK